MDLVCQTKAEGPVLLLTSCVAGQNKSCPLSGSELPQLLPGENLFCTRCSQKPPELGSRRDSAVAAPLQEGTLPMDPEQPMALRTLLSPISHSAPLPISQTATAVRAGPGPCRLGSHLPGPSMAEGGTGGVPGTAAFTTPWQGAAPASWRVSQAVRSCLSVGRQPAR